MTDPLPPRAVAQGAATAGRRGLARNTSFSVMHQFIAIGLAVLLIPFLINRLGTEKYGLWLILQVFNISGLLSLAELGFQGAIIRYLVRYHAEGDTTSFRKLLVTAFTLFAVIGGLCATAVIVFANTAFTEVFAVPAAYVGEMRLSLTIVGAGAVVAFPSLVLKAYYSATQDVATLKVWETLDRLIFTGAVIGLLFFTDKILHIVLVEQATVLIMVTAFGVLARRRAREWFSINPRYASWVSLKSVSGLSGMVFATSISNQVYLRAPEAIVGAILGPVALAHYQIATRIPRVMKSLQGALNAPVLPYVAGLDDLSAQSQKAKRRFALIGLRWNYLLFVPICVFVAVFAAEILTLWVGAHFGFLGTFVGLYGLWQLASVIIGFGNATLTRSEHYRRLVWHNMLMNVLFLAGVALFLEDWGLWAVFLSLLAAGGLSALAVLAATRKANGFTYREFAREVVMGPVLGSAMVGLALFGTAKAVLGWAGTFVGVAAIGIGGMAYLSVIYFGFLSGSERQRLADALAKRRGGK